MRASGLPDLDLPRVRRDRKRDRDRPCLVRRDPRGAHPGGFPGGGPRILDRARSASVDRGFALTIDDGLQSIWEVAEVVARHKATATVFVVTDRVGSDNAWPGQPAQVSRERLLSWTDLESLSPLGFRFAAHGRTHRPLDRCDDSQLADERGSRDAIEQRLGRPCPLFAYPYGRSNPRVHQAARRCFSAAFGTRLDTASAGQDLHRLSRIDAYYLRSTRRPGSPGHRPVAGLAPGSPRALCDGRGALTAPSPGVSLGPDASSDDQPGILRSSSRLDSAGISKFHGSTVFY